MEPCQSQCISAGQINGTDQGRSAAILGFGLTVSSNLRQVFSNMRVFLTSSAYATVLSTGYIRSSYKAYPSD